MGEGDGGEGEGDGGGGEGEGINGGGGGDGGGEGDGGGGLGDGGGGLGGGIGGGEGEAEGGGGGRLGGDGSGLGGNVGGGLGGSGGGVGGGSGGGEGDGGGGLGEGDGGLGGGDGGSGGDDGEGGEAGGGILQQASLQFTESDFLLFVVVEHNFLQFFFLLGRLHHLVTLFWSFFLHVFFELSLSAVQFFGDGAEAKSTGNHCGGTALISDWRAWAVELGLDEMNGFMVLVPVVPASTGPCQLCGETWSGSQGGTQ